MYSGLNNYREKGIPFQIRLGFGIKRNLLIYKIKFKRFKGIEQILLEMI